MTPTYLTETVTIRASDYILQQVSQDPEGLAQRLGRSLEVTKEFIKLVRSQGFLDPEDIERLRIVPDDLRQRCLALQPPRNETHH